MAGTRINPTKRADQANAARNQRYGAVIARKQQEADASTLNAEANNRNARQQMALTKQQGKNQIRNTKQAGLQNRKGLRLGFKNNTALNQQAAQDRTNEAGLEQGNLMNRLSQEHTNAMALNTQANNFATGLQNSQNQFKLDNRQTKFKPFTMKTFDKDGIENGEETKFYNESAGGFKEDPVDHSAGVGADIDELLTSKKKKEPGLMRSIFNMSPTGALINRMSK